MHWLRREALLAAIFGGFGLLVLPALVYLVGQQLLGEYRPDAGLGTFYADLFARLGTPSPWVWLLVLGPYLAVQVLRLLWLPFGLLMRRHEAAPQEARPDDPGDDPADAAI